MRREYFRQYRCPRHQHRPLEDPSLVIEREDGTHDSSAASTSPTSGAESYALHYTLPANGHSNDDDDSAWPRATTYSNETVGVDNKPSYTNFANLFIGSGAVFIWSSNLVLDNEVLVRFTTQNPSQN